MFGIKVLAGAVFVVIAQAAVAQPPARFEFAEDHMGTRVRMVVYAADEPAAKAATRAAFDRIAELNRIMSDYLPTSELMQLCRQAGGPPMKVSPELFFILERSQDFARLTDGAFDVTVGPIVRLWRRARKLRELPSAEQIDEARKLVDFRLLKLNAAERTVQLEKSGMQIDLGGIAKGYAADEAQKVLKKHGITSALVALGGDIVVTAPPPGTAGWRVGITPLGDEEQGTPTMLLHDCGVSTAGDTEQFVEIGGVRYSHIVDPKTGMGLTTRIQVTVVAKDGTTADGLDTGLAVLGAERALPIVEKLEGVSARMVWKNKSGALEERRSKRFPEFLK
jgi:thiamine biosynthesis lipoprotein